MRLIGMALSLSGSPCTNMSALAAFSAMRLSLPLIGPGVSRDGRASEAEISGCGALWGCFTAFATASAERRLPGIGTTRLSA
jgi:hypothetical protein